MGRSVPLARRNLFQERRRALLAVAGLAVALLLVLVLDGIFAGAMRQVTAYVDGSPADVIVSQGGVTTMHMSASALPPERVEAARDVDGVAWAEGIRFTTALLASGDGRQLTYVIGYEGRGGPDEIVRGGEPGAGETIVDEIAADQMGIDLGDEVLVMGSPFRVSGLARGGTSITNTTTYLRSEDYSALRGDAVSYVLVGAAEGSDARELSEALEEALPGTTAQTRSEFAREEAKIVADMSADVMRIMTTIGFAIALAVVGLTLFTVTLAKLREFGVLKALGARPLRLARIVVSQAAWSVGVALLVAVGLAFVIGFVIAEVAPTIQLAVEPGTVLRTGLGAAVVGALGALIPLRRVLRVDPASAFRRPS